MVKMIASDNVYMNSEKNVYPAAFSGLRKDIFANNALRGCHLTQDGVESSDA